MKITAVVSTSSTRPLQSSAGTYKSSKYATPPATTSLAADLYAQKHPLTLTDGTTYIEATLTPSCLEDLITRYPGKRVSSTTPHLVIALRKYTIRVTAYGPRRSYLTLILDSIDWLGEGPARYFDTAVPVTSCPDVFSSLLKLWKIRIEVDCQCWLKNTDGEVIMPPAGNRSDEEAASQTNTQMPYGTQMVQPHRERIDNSPAISRTKQTASLDGGSTPREDIRTSGPDAKAAKQAQLLSLLHAARSVPPVAPAAPSAGGFARTNPPNVRGDMAAPATTARTPLLPGRPDRFRSDPTNTSRPTMPAHRADSRSKPVLEIDMDVEPQPVLDRALAALVPSEPREEDSDDEEPPWLQDCRPTCGSATVPAKQRTLLSKAESWQKPDAGHRFPDANIPIDLLREFREHARMTVLDETSSPISDDDEEELSDAHAEDIEDDILDRANADADTDSIADEAHPTSEESWSSSSVPEPPKRPGLPPDSSLDDGKSTNTHSAHNKQANIPKRSEPVVIESSNETADVPSSPPEIQQDDDFDEEMELEVPRGLVDSPANNLRTSAPVFTRPVSVVQVKETPSAKGKSGVTVLPPRQQTSSGESKHASSTSVVYCTYKDQNSPGDREATYTRAGESASASASSTRKLPTAVSRLDLEVLSPALTSKHARFPLAETGDVHMEDASQDISQAPIPPNAHHEASKAYAVDRNEAVAFLEPSPISAQRPPPNSSSSGEKAPKVLPANPGELPKTPTIRPELAQMKRKLDNSPSKKSNRSSKRREIKIVGFGDQSPPRDTATDFRHARHESLSRFREERRSGYVAANRSGKTSFDSDLQSRTAPLTRHSDAQAGAETDQLHHAPPEIGGLGDVHTRDHPSASAVCHRDPSPVEMDVDDPFQEENTQSSMQNINSTLETSFGSTRAAHALSTTKKEAMHRSPMSTSTQRPMSETVFQIFKAAYPDYTGSTQHFIGQCKQMHKLDLEDKMVPKWQWDDFIIRNRTDYKDYILHCGEEGDDPEPYHRFYKDNIRDTLYNKGIIKNRKTLVAALEELETRPSADATASAHLRATAYPTAPEPLMASPSMAPPVASAPSPIVAPVKKSTRKSLPWGPSQSVEPSEDPVDSSSRDRSRRSLPTATHKAQPAPYANSPLRRTPLHASIAKSSVVQPSRKSSSRGGTATPLARPSPGRSTAKRSLDLSKIPDKPTGDTYRDFIFAWQRSTSLTGSTEVSSCYLTLPLTSMWTNAGRLILRNPGPPTWLCAQRRKFHAQKATMF